MEIIEAMFGKNLIKKDTEICHTADSPDLSLMDGAVWPIMRRYIHPDNNINPLELSIARANEWYDPENVNGISAHWTEWQNWLIGIG